LNLRRIVDSFDGLREFPAVVMTYSRVAVERRFAKHGAAPDTARRAVILAFDGDFGWMRARRRDGWNSRVDPRKLCRELLVFEFAMGVLAIEPRAVEPARFRARFNWLRPCFRPIFGPRDDT